MMKDAPFTKNAAVYTAASLNHPWRTGHRRLRSPSRNISLPLIPRSNIFHDLFPERGEVRMNSAVSGAAHGFRVALLPRSSRP